MRAPKYTVMEYYKGELKSAFLIQTAKEDNIIAFATDFFDEYQEYSRVMDVDSASVVYEIGWTDEDDDYQDSPTHGVVVSVVPNQDAKAALIAYKLGVGYEKDRYFEDPNEIPEYDKSKYIRVDLIDLDVKK